MKTAIMMRTDRRAFSVAFQRTQFYTAHVQVPDHLAVVLLDGVPMVELPSAHASNRLPGKLGTELVDLQEADRRGLVKADVEEPV